MLKAIRENEPRAISLGYDAERYKLLAFVLSATITGLVGGVWFLYLTQVLPQSGFDPLFDLSLVLMAFLGGLGTISGPIIGALIIQRLGSRITMLSLSAVAVASALWMAAVPPDPLSTLKLANEFIWLTEDTPTLMAGRVEAAIKRASGKDATAYEETKCQRTCSATSSSRRSSRRSRS